MNVFIVPQFRQWPQSGGVREHMRLLWQYASNDPEVKVVDSPRKADLIHIESAYTISSQWPKKPIVYVCHGGFVPNPIPTVKTNIDKADQVVSVAHWLVTSHFPPNAYDKTIVINNGIDLPEYDNVQPIQNISKQSVLYGKDYLYNPAEFVRAMFVLRNVEFYSVIPMPIPPQFNMRNFKTLGVQPKHIMNRIIKSVGCLMMTGSEVNPTMVLEAWACGVPVVAYAVDGNLELMWSERKNRFLGGIGYTDNPRVAIEYVLANREKLGAEGRKIIEIKYTMQRTWDKFKNVYRNLLETGKPLSEF